MKRALPRILPGVLPVVLLLAGCSGSNLNTSHGPNGEAIVGNTVSVQVSRAASQQAAFSLAQDYCSNYHRSARFVAQTGDTAAFDCVKAN
jgi:hypothetical protein